jgi:hypothetical protein
MIARSAAQQKASYTGTPIGSRGHEENCQQLHDPD